jgi:hypothetical protein
VERKGIDRKPRSLTKIVVRPKHLRGGMRILAKRIERELQVQTEKIGHCAIYEDELQRIWPLDEENRKAKIAQFAKEYGFQLSFYKQGLCAISVKEPHEVLGNHR